MPGALNIAPVEGPEQIEIAGTLFRAYIDSLGIDLSFQAIEDELRGLPGKYAHPAGQILLAWYGNDPVGCVAARPLPEAGTCEMKRLFVRPEARGQDAGRRLARAIITFAKDAGYTRIRLDTLASMSAAQRLYASLGFRRTGPYYDNPLPGTMFLTLDL